MGSVIRHVTMSVDGFISVPEHADVNGIYGGLTRPFSRSEPNERTRYMRDLIVSSSLLWTGVSKRPAARMRTRASASPTKAESVGGEMAPTKVEEELHQAGGVAVKQDR